MFGPILLGERVTLRPPIDSEGATMMAWFADKEVVARLCNRFPPSADQQREFLDAQARDPASLFWAIEVEGQLVGTTGIRDIDWANQRGETGTVIGDKSMWGQGIASEAMRLRTDYAFANLPLRKLTSSYMEGNEASRKAQTRVGYREVGRRNQQYFRSGGWLDEILTEVLREDWEKGRA